MNTYEKLPYNKKSHRRGIVEHLIEKETRILEIGALNSPTFYTKDARVTIADWLSREQLEAHYKNKSGIVDVDLIVEGDILTSAQKQGFLDFDIIIANHVIEHIPDVIGWLGQLGKISRKDGYLSMAVPDRRYTFDFIRGETDVVDLIDCHRRALSIPDFRQILKHLYFKKNVVASDIWDETLRNETLEKKRFELNDAVKKAMEMEGEFHSLHCSVFTSGSFENAMNDLYKARIIPWKIERLVDVQTGSNEFLVLMKNAPL